MPVYTLLALLHARWPYGYSSGRSWPCGAALAKALAAGRGWPLWPLLLLVALARAGLAVLAAACYTRCRCLGRSAFWRRTCSARRRRWRLTHSTRRRHPDAYKPAQAVLPMPTCAGRRGRCWTHRLASGCGGCWPRCCWRRRWRARAAYATRCGQFPRWCCYAWWCRYSRPAKSVHYALLLIVLLLVLGTAAAPAVAAGRVKDRVGVAAGRCRHISSIRGWRWQGWPWALLAYPRWMARCCWESCCLVVMQPETVSCNRSRITID
ncbi:MAG: hypothetical protein U0Z44_06740 [Kouleothrix sp.]